MIAYASRTGTRRNLEALRRAGWRLMVSATGVLRHEGFRYALDNGAWTAYQARRPFDTALFVRALEKLGADADWCVLPDVVGEAEPSLAFSLSWLERVLGLTPHVLLAVQDGMEPETVRALGILGPRVGLFVGGSPFTDWKDRTMGAWCALAHEHGAWAHVGRVNTNRRIRLCAASGADSFDGSSASKFAVTLKPLDSARRNCSRQLNAAIAHVN